MADMSKAARGVDRVKRGIAAYERDQRVIIRLLKRCGGSFTERDFDRWFRGREFRRRILFRPLGLTGDTFLLGASLLNGGTEWARMLDLLHCMAVIGIVEAKEENDLMVYRLKIGV